MKKSYPRTNPQVQSAKLFENEKERNRQQQEEAKKDQQRKTNRATGKRTRKTKTHPEHK